MSNVVTTLLDFILDLLRDPQAAADYERNPAAAIQNAGLTGVTQADVSSAMGIVSDCSPVSGWQGGVADSHHPVHSYAPHHENHPQGVEAAHRNPQHDDHRDDDHRDDDHHDRPDHAEGQEMAVFQHVTNVENDITITKIDASHSIWANGDANLLFGDHDILNTGNGTVLSDVEATRGGSIDIHNTPVNVSLEDSLNGSFNHTEGDGNAVGVGNHVDNSQDNDNYGSNNWSNGDLNAAGGDQHVGDETTIGDIEVKDNNLALGNGSQIADDGGQVADDGGVNADDGATVVNDSFNPEDSFNDTDVRVDDINVVDADGGTAVVGNELDVKDSFNGNDFAGGDIDDSQDFLSDNAVAVDDSAAATDPDLVLAGG